MNVCIPVVNDQGGQSVVCAHFGSAPLFMIADTESGATRVIPNRNMHHGHGMCQPLQALQGERLDGIVVGGIGAGALQKLLAANLRVYLAVHATVDETVAAFKAGKLQQVTPDLACAGHGHGRGGW